MSTSRRSWLTAALGAGAASALAGAQPPSAVQGTSPPIGDEGVGPAEDLMREHGVLNRILLIYDEGIRRTRVLPHATATDTAALADRLGQFVRMYRPHEAREDTVLFPAFRELVPREEYERLGEQLESREDEVLGRRGFERIVDEVAGIERGLGIYDLASFTPTG
jgi:hypothetical protein